jgi:uncharacterized protein YlxP (DUF503 family)
VGLGRIDLREAAIINARLHQASPISRSVAMIRIGLLTAQFHLPGCDSLKEKRRRLARLRDKFGREPRVAICESDFQDDHQRAEWSCLAVANDKVAVERQLQAIENFIAEEIDAVVTALEREFH